jgi:hypothetical protein
MGWVDKRPSVTGRSKLNRIQFRVAIAHPIYLAIRAIAVADPLVLGADDARGEVDPYLLPGEQNIIGVRKYPAIPLSLFCLLVAAVVFAGLLTAGTFPVNVIVVGVAWTACAFMLVWSLVATKVWSATFFVVTERRLLFIGGLDARKVAIVPVAEIWLTMRRSLVGRLIDYGTFVIKWSGQPPVLRKTRYIPYPEQLYLEICGRILPGELDDDDIDQTGRFYPGVYGADKR